MKLIALVSAAYLLVPSFSQHPFRELENAVETQSNAYIAMPARLVCGPRVSAFSWSSDGKYLLVQTQSDVLRAGDRMSNTISLLLWSDKTGKVETIWSKKNVNDLHIWFDWLPASNIAIVSIRETVEVEREPLVLGYHTSIFKLDTTARTLQPIAMVNSLSTDNLVSIELSPLKPILLVTSFERTPAATPPSNRIIEQLLDRNGKTIAQAQVPEGITFAIPMWDSEGNCILRCFSGQRNIPQRWHSFSATGLKALDEKPRLYEDKPKDHPLKAELLSAPSATKNKTRPVDQLWLVGDKEGEFHSTLVSADADEAQLAPDLSAIAFVSQGVLLVRPMLKLTIQEFEKAKDSAKRTELMSRANQVGTALIMFSADNGDKFPAKTDDLAGILGPYLQNDSTLDGFVYTFAGGKIPDNVGLAELEMGYLAGSGGRAIVYGDGHVRWRRD